MLQFNWQPLPETKEAQTTIKLIDYSVIPTLLMCNCHNLKMFVSESYLTIVVSAKEKQIVEDKLRYGNP